MSFNNPYEVLGVSETDSIEHIEMAYKGFMKILHPDKANTPEAKRLGMTTDEKSFLLPIYNTSGSNISSFLIGRNSYFANACVSA